MTNDPITFAEVTTTVASLLSASLEPDTPYDLNTPEGLGNICEHYGLERNLAIDLRASGGTPDFLLGLLGGISLGRAQVRAEAGAEAEPTADQDDEFLESIAPEGEQVLDTAESVQANAEAHDVGTVNQDAEVPA